ncbi:hypothetical protein QUC31_020519 [Theobroma cacao]
MVLSIQVIAVEEITCISIHYTQLIIPCALLVLVASFQKVSCLLIHLALGKLC